MPSATHDPAGPPPGAWDLLGYWLTGSLQPVALLVVAGAGPALFAWRSPHDEAVATYIRETTRLRGR
ncbi:hypothetical protein [Cryptosporangium aurantiacum]|uniref:Uncharacterized protein n=1 Tax=Cryptosporangium aurantiacum TaxID=134849 RepID=A0A1M7TV78_9ACTN|nr:hypothetical protein [Cryptosporangium aurantiacum]SHN74580.1 hypothetical protein SAMN05443668_107110 [Cryptosporangium aurantiacum]